MEHEERYYLMMMGALDNELPDADRDELMAHLDGCADCRREWQALLAIDTLFRQTPLLMPAVNFAERTLALLPSSRLRVRALSAVYLILLASGVVPLLLALFLVARYAPILQQPALVERVVATLVNVGRVAATVVGALLAGAGRFVVEQPAVVGLMILLAGFVLLWGGVLQRLLAQPAPIRVRNRG